MALIAPVKDGKLETQSASSASLKEANESKGMGTTKIDSEAFLTLLVAEMQNQDPLEPTSNTEWISQYATFTQVSEVQAIGDAMDSMKADGLVGKHVIMSVTKDDGTQEEIDGKVDFVKYEKGKAFLSIEGSLYSVEDLESVIGDEYMAAYDKADAFAKEFEKLPLIKNLTVADIPTIEKRLEEYNALSDYEKDFISQDAKDTVKLYKDALETLKSKAVDVDN